MDRTSREILSRRAPLLDVRAPVEFQQGAFPNSVNLPLLTDDERHRVGTEYRKRGREAAIELGHSIVSGQSKSDRVRRWVEFADCRPGALVCCARGGLRSEIAARWLGEAGCKRQRVTGGFKALRLAALEFIAEAASQREWTILGGRTGGAKTHLLGELTGSLDFEGCANHRGSSFGGHATPQPSQVTFENRLASKLAVLSDDKILVEDEGRNLGRLAIPEAMVMRMRRSDVVVLELPRSSRIENILADYITAPIEAGEMGDALSVRYREGLARLRKRLGGKRWSELDALIETGFASADLEAHRAWIGGLLDVYYDPMYDYQIEKKGERVVFSGDLPAVRKFLAERGFEGRP